jgi:hypothetical protein
MRPTEAEKLLGGHATGTLSEAERRTLFAAALERQELFDALLDEEALRELLADPAMKAQLIAELAGSAPPRVVPLWRRPALLGAAAGLIVAATAGLAYLRGPIQAPPPLRESPGPAPAPAAPAAPVPPLPAKKQAPSAPAAVPLPAPAEAAPQSVQAEGRSREVQKAEAPRSAGAMMDAARPAARASAKVAEAPAPRVPPAWSLEAQPDGSTRVRVWAPRGPQAVLLRRGAAGVEVLALRAGEAGEADLVLWRGEVRLGAGDVLDLYLLDGPAADPSKLPETGPVGGFRARIHPAAKNEAPR